MLIMNILLQEEYVLDKIYKYKYEIDENDISNLITDIIFLYENITNELSQIEELSPITKGLIIGAISPLGGAIYGTYRYLTSISRYEEKIAALKQTISELKPSERKVELTNQLVVLNQKLERAKERGRKERATLIQKTKDLKERIKIMDKQYDKLSYSDKTNLAKMKEKLNSNMQIMKKIDAVI